MPAQQNIAADFSDPGRRQAIALAMALAKNMDKEGPSLCLRALQSQGYTITDGFVLMDFLAIAASELDQPRNQIIQALTEYGLPASSINDVVTFWNLNVPPCELTLAQCEELFRLGVARPADKPRPEPASDALARAASSEELLDALVSEGMDEALLQFMREPAPLFTPPLAHEPEDFGAVPRPLIGQLRSVIKAIRSSAAQPVPRWILKACLVCRGGLSIAWADKLVATALDGSVTRQTLRANIADETLCQLPWDRLLEGLDGTGGHADLEAVAKLLPAEQYALVRGLIDETRDEFVEMGAAVNKLTAFISDGGVNADLGAIEAYKGGTSVPGPSMALSLHERVLLGSLANANIVTYTMGQSQARNIVLLALRTGGDLSSAKLLCEGWFAATRGPTGAPEAMDVRDVLVKDFRRPILYLRSHMDDAPSDSNGTRNVEEEIVHWHREFGPVVALLNPHVQHASLRGSFKFDPAGLNWRQCVLATMLWARFVIIRANTTDNLLWEIDLAAQIVSPTSLIFVFERRHEADLARNDPSYTLIRTIIERHTSASLPELQPRELVLTFDQDWQTRWLGDPSSTQRSGAESVSHALDSSAHHQRQARWVRCAETLTQLKGGDTRAIALLAQMGAFKDELQGAQADPEPSERQEGSHHQMSRWELKAGFSVSLEEYFMTKKYELVDEGLSGDLLLTVPVKRRLWFFKFNSRLPVIRIHCTEGAVHVTVLDPQGNALVDELTSKLLKTVHLLGKDFIAPTYVVSKYVDRAPVKAAAAERRPL